MSEKTEVLRQWYSRIWEDGDLDAIPEFFSDTTQSPHAPDGVLVPGFTAEPGELREWLLIVNSFVENVKVTLLRTLEQGPWVSALMQISCNQCHTGKKVTVYQQVMARIENGKITESYPSFDFIRFFEQLGQLPEETHALLLAGARLN